MERNKKKDLSLAEAMEYFDTHDIFGPGEATEVKGVVCQVPKKKYVGLNVRLFKKIEKAARKAHKSEDRLIEEWLTEKVG